VSETISNLRRLCEVGRKRRKIRMNAAVRATEKSKKTGVTVAMTATAEIQEMASHVMTLNRSLMFPSITPMSDVILF
jgi:hypothetical protein